MKIVVLNGSPKGQYSVSLHTVLFIQKHFPEHDFQVLHISQRIRAIEKEFQNPQDSPTLQAIVEADLVLFCYPVYTFLVPAQLHRFIELLKASGVSLQGKKVAQICTSKHFYDITANRFIEENAADMGMVFLETLSADMDDLLTPKGQEQALSFFKMVLWKMSSCKDGKTQKECPEKRTEKRVAIVADLAPDDSELQEMIDCFRRVMPYPTTVYNIREFPFQGGCLSCFHCAKDGKCVYTDGFDTYLRDNIQLNDALVYAFKIQDHSMGSRFKMFDDRQFCNGHRTVTMGKPVAYLVEGNYSQERNLQMVIEGHSEVGGNYLAGVATNEFDSVQEISKVATILTYALDNQYTKPANFLGAGGSKIFRDLIYMMRGLMRADHKFFKKHGQYDFPHKRRKDSWLMYLVGWMMNTPKIRKKMGNRINEGMISSYKKVVDNAKQ